MAKLMKQVKKKKSIFKSVGKQNTKVESGTKEISMENIGDHEPRTTSIKSINQKKTNITLWVKMENL